MATQETVAQLPNFIVPNTVGGPPSAAGPKIYVQAAPQAPSDSSGSSGLILALLIIAVVIIGYYYWSRSKGGSSLAKDLASCGWVLYMMPGCGYCHKQMDVLGVKVYPKQVVCKGGMPASPGTNYKGKMDCGAIKAYPHWENEKTGETRTGLQTTSQLQSMLDYDLAKAA